MSNLHTYIEPELEARITALVLGEASEFEVDELERLIEERPELAIFRRRIKVMHELLGDAMRPQKDEKWQLSKDRRDVLKRTFFKAGQPVTAKHKPKSRGTSKPKNQIRASVVIAACVMLCFILFMMATPVYKLGKSESFSPEIVLYSASEEEQSEVSYSRRSTSRKWESNRDSYGRNLAGEKRPVPPSAPKAAVVKKMKLAEKSVAENKRGVPILGDIPVTGELFKNKRKSKREGMVAKREVTRSVERKPSIPSSSMAKVIASNTTTRIPIPDASILIPSSSVYFSTTEDFGDGWGSGSSGGGMGSGGIADAGDPFGEESDRGRSKAGRVHIAGQVAIQDRVVRRELPLGLSSHLTERLDAAHGHEGEKSIVSNGNVAPGILSLNGLFSDGKVQLGSQRIDQRYAWTDNVSAYAGASIGGQKKDLSDYLNFEDQPSVGFNNFSRVAGANYIDNPDANSVSAYTGSFLSSITPEDRLADFEKGGVEAGLYDISANDSAKGKSPIRWSAGFSFGVDDNVDGDGLAHQAAYEGERLGAEADGKPTTQSAGEEVRHAIDNADFETIPFSGAGSVSSIAQKEIARRSSLVVEADRALLKGREAYAKGDMEEATKQYQLAQSMLPPGPSLADRRHSYNGYLGDASVALAQKYRRVGKYDEARQLLEGTLGKDPSNFAAKKQLEYLDDPIRTNPALNYEHTQNVDRVRKHLYMGEGYYNLGKYDEAEKELRKTLKVDPYNKAARRWLEKVEATKSSYYRAAYDHTRAELLKDVDKAWEMAVPPTQQPIVSNRPLAKPTSKPTPKLAMPTRPGISVKDGKLAAIKVELQNKNDRVSELRKRLMDVAEKTGLIYVETEDGGRTVGDVTALRDVAEKELYDAEGKKRQLAFQFNKLSAVQDDDLISVASKLPDVGFKQAHDKYEEAKSKLATIKASGLSDNHPDVAMRKKKVQELEKNLKKRAVNVRESLKHNLALVEGRVENMRKVVNSQQDQGLDKARSMQELNVARKEYEIARGIRDGIEAKYDKERSQAIARGEKAPAKMALKRLTTTIPSPITPKALPDETTTVATPFSTFSLNVADVSFKLAKVALLEKGQWPNAAKVRTEEFVNAFDYGDPSPRRGEPVACAIDQSVHPFLQQRNLLRVGMKTASIGRSVPLRLTVLLDNSGSMEREDREASVLAAIQVLASQLGPQDVITVVGFARQPRLLADRMRGDQAHKLVEIVANTPSEGGTNIEEALRLARTLAKRQHTEGAQDRIVLITDGVANLGNTIPEELSKQIVAMRQEGIAFDACGVGAEGLNDDILEALTRKGDGRYYFLNRAEDADSGFAKQLAGALTPAAKNVKVQVKFNPKRVTRYRLLGFEKHRLKKEDFRNDKVDAAEMAAEEAGNAVYQIQVNPQGVGELGEVFVRFLDASTGRMVERSWPLPYEPKASSFDLAAPSMQLAGTAAMLGEKLHGTDAGSVRFSMISDTLNKLRGHYGADSKVQDLLRMCRKVE